jgi:hypothetical protein
MVTSRSPPVQEMNEEINIFSQSYPQAKVAGKRHLSEEIGAKHGAWQAPSW